jgi:DinB superfamily
MSDATLLMLMNDVRGKTLRLLDGVDGAQARFSPPGLFNSILWHAGHALVVNEQLGVAAATGKSAACPDGWIEMFGWQSQPATITQWPALADVVAELRDQQVRFAPLIQGLTAEQLDRAMQHGTVRHSIMHGLHDEACHQGEIWLLKKIWKNRT